jgi:hypothetical protein
MKKLIFFLCVIALAACGGGGATVEGKWQLNSVSGEELSESEKSATIEFMSDGNFVMKRGDRERKGTWKLSDDGKTLTATEEGGDAKEWTNVEVTEDALSFTERDDKISFKKIK